MTNSHPKISIITVCLNTVDTIERTILSVINQTYGNIEYIIIDGGSTDGTLDIIKKYTDKIDHLVSEPDRGIYDAMNKGTKLARGDWINYMNAGDKFVADDVINKVFSRDIDPKTALIYGDGERCLEDCSYIFKAKPLANLWRGKYFFHNAMFVANKIAKAIPYNIKFNIAADFNFVYMLYKENSSFLYIPICMTSFYAEGVSDIKCLQSVMEQWKIIRQHEGFNITKELYYLLLFLKVLVCHSIKKCLPKKLVNKIRLLKNTLALT